MSAPMQRRHFESIAEILRATTPLARDGDDAMTMWKVVVIRFAQRLEQTNARFDRERFLEACGMGEEREQIEQERYERTMRIRGSVPAGRP